MEAVTGIKYTKDSKSKKHYVRVDLDLHGENQLLEDFLDMLDIEARKNEPTYPLEEVLARENKRRGLDKCIV